MKPLDITFESPRFSWWQIQAKRFWREAQLAGYFEMTGRDPYNYGLDPDRWERRLWFNLEVAIAKWRRNGKVSLPSQDSKE